MIEAADRMVGEPTVRRRVWMLIICFCSSAALSIAYKNGAAIPAAPPTSRAPPRAVSFIAFSLVWKALAAASAVPNCRVIKRMPALT
jgi:hypothetical protein